MAGLGLGQIAASAAMGAGAAYILTIVHPDASPNIAIVTGVACALTALVSFWLMGKQQTNDTGFGLSSGGEGGSAGSGGDGREGKAPPPSGKHKALSGGAGARRPKAGKGR